MWFYLSPLEQLLADIDERIGLDSWEVSQSFYYMLEHCLGIVRKSPLYLGQYGASHESSRLKVIDGGT